VDENEQKFSNLPDVWQVLRQILLHFFAAENQFSDFSGKFS